MANRVHPRYENAEFPDWEFREYPLMYYPGAPDQKRPYDSKGRPLTGVIVNDEDEHKLLVDADRRAQAGDESAAPALVATGARGVSRVRTPEDERAELIEEAEALGVTFDRRWGAAKIQNAIDEHRELLKQGQAREDVV